MCVPTMMAPDCLAEAGRTSAASSGVFHLEGRVESAAAPTAAPNTFMASRRDNLFSDFGGSFDCNIFHIIFLFRLNGKLILPEIKPGGIAGFYYGEKNRVGSGG